MNFKPLDFRSIFKKRKIMQDKKSWLGVFFPVKSCQTTDYFRNNFENDLVPKILLRNGLPKKTKRIPLRATIRMG